MHTRDIDRGSSGPRHLCWVFSRCGEGYAGCRDTTTQASLGWVPRGYATSVAAARSICQGYTHVSLQCPTSVGMQVHCVAGGFAALPSLPDAQCMGDLTGSLASTGSALNTSNMACTGPFLWDQNAGGGYNRGAVYAVPAGAVANGGLGTRDLALHRPSTQSSTAYGGVARRAVDGNAAQSYSSGSCTYTDTESDPWWRVDLQQARSQP